MIEKSVSSYIKSTVVKIAVHKWVVDEMEV